MARAPVRPVSAPSQIQAASTPVNSYVRPADPAPSSLHQLAEGLAALDSGMGGFMQKRKDKTEAADKQRAIRDAYVANGAGFDEGTKNGSIPPQESPAYMTWYKTTQGDVQGRKLRDQFAIQYQTWEGRNSGDPKAFQEFVGKFLQTNLGDSTDPEVLAGLNPHIEALQNEAYGQFTTDRSAAVKGGALSTSGAILTDNIERAEADGRASGQVDYEKLWADILPVREEALKRNLAADYDPVLVDAIILQAEEAGNEELLGLLEKTLPGQDHPISYDIKVREKRDAAIARIQSGQASKATTKAAAEDKADKERHNALVATELAKINADPNYIVPEETLKDLSRRDPEFRTKLGGYRKSLISDGTPEDPDAVLEVYSQIDAGRGAEFINEMRRLKVIKDPETYTKMLDRVERLKNANKSGGMFTTETYKDLEKRIGAAAGTGEFDYFGTVKGITAEASAALFDLRTQLLQWEIDNPQLAKNGLAKEKAANEIGEAIFKRITPADAAPGGKPIYDDPDAPKPTPAAPTEGDKGAVEPDVVPEVQKGEVAPPDTIDGAAKALAEKYKISPEEAQQLLLEETKAEAPAAEESDEDGGLITNALSFLSSPFQAAVDAGEAMYQGDFLGLGNKGDPSEIPEADRTRLTSLLSNPPKMSDGTTASNIPAAPLLNLIGGTEGTDKGDGYNETLAYGKFTDGDVNLVGMTLDEIDALQTRMLRHPDNNFPDGPSSAIGRYQIVRTTLRDIREELNLKGDQVFDRRMQDRLAMHLLERRGLSKWQAGELSDEDFMSGLSKEWASLPKADGKGSYKGQRTGTNAAGLRGVLNKVRSGEGVQVASLDPSAGFPQDIPQAYSKLPAVDDRGEDQIAKFKEWNSDPVGNHEANLSKLQPTLQSVIKRAQEAGGVRFVIGSGVRDEAMQKKAVEWGWSKTEDSDHMDGSSVDLWPLDKDGAVVFDKKQQSAIVKAMKQAAKEVGVKLAIGADWKGFRDAPHFAIRN